LAREMFTRILNPGELHPIESGMAQRPESGFLERWSGRPCQKRFPGTSGRCSGTCESTVGLPKTR
jgi:hypothetical protein